VSTFVRVVDSSWGLGRAGLSTRLESRLSTDEEAGRVVNSVHEILVVNSILELLFLEVLGGRLLQFLIELLSYVSAEQRSHIISGVGLRSVANDRPCIVVVQGLLGRSLVLLAEALLLDSEDVLVAHLLYVLMELLDHSFTLLHDVEVAHVHVVGVEEVPSTESLLLEKAKLPGLGRIIDFEL